MKLYKYVHNNRVDILTNCKIRFTQPQDWNDLFEFEPHYENYIEKNPLKTLVEQANIIKDAKENGIFPTKEKLDTLKAECKRLSKNQVYEYINRELVGLSVTEDKENLLMWAHYANNNNGFVIEFDTETPFFKSNDRYLFKLKYDQKRPKITLEKFAEIIVTTVENLKTKEKLSEHMQETISDAFKKSVDWEYEKEWRLITVTDRANNFDTFKNNRSIYHIGKNPITNKYIALYRIHPSTITAVYCGARIDSNTLRKLYFLIKYNKAFAHIKLIKTETDKELYSLNYSDVRSYDALKAAECEFEENNNKIQLKYRMNPFYIKYEKEKQEYKNLLVTG